MDIESFSSKLCESLGDGFSYHLEVAFSVAYKSMFRADSVISRGELPYILIEHKGIRRITSPDIFTRISSYQDYLRIIWSVIFFEDTGEIFLRLINGVEYEPFGNIAKLANAILTKATPHDREEYRLEIIRIINDHISQLNQQDAVKAFADGLAVEDIVPGSSQVSFTPGAEARFFESLLGKVSDPVISRYTSKNTLYQIMDYGTFGMCSLNCMNDSSELDYADEYVDGVKKPIDACIKECNDIFISSACSENMSDNLLMWRLYAQNAEGVCLNLAIDREDLAASEFYLYPISYGESDSCHAELDIIKTMMSWPISGPRFVFNNWKVWKHFFKSHHFKYEEEIRLLYFKNPSDKLASLNWIHDSYTGIASPIIIFQANDFPLKLKNVIIGPRDSRSYHNSVQLNERVKDTCFKNSVDSPFCRESDIKIYR